MVQILADPATPENGDGHRSNAVVSKQEDAGRQMSREEHAQRMRELNMKRGVMRAPRRGWSMTDYQGDHSHQPAATAHASYFDRHVPIPENSALPSSAFVAPAPAPSPKDIQQVQLTPKPVVAQLPERPKLPPPRRSYSVMDYEPAPPNQPKPSSRMTLLDLPSEVHYLFCDYLDPIDSVCFGLAHSRLYDIHRRKYGSVPLSSRYSGPNDMEWAWRGAGPLVDSLKKAPEPAADTTTETGKELASMRTRGQVYCRKCGISRCELHRHLKDWMGEGMEYCEIREMYGKLPSENAKDYCYMSSPKNPHRCGRHGGKKA